MAHEINKRGLELERQKVISIQYDHIRFDEAFRADLIVNDLVILELKTVEQVLPQHKKQLLTYLRLTNKRLGLLINFNAELIKQGISRIVNQLPE